MTGYDVIVIGAGLAGLSAASALAERGARVLVLEARPRLGGRATAFRDGSTGELVDNGQHVLFGCYRDTFAFLRRIGTADRVRVQPRLRVPMVLPDGRRSTLEVASLPAPLHLAAGVLEWSAVPWRERFAVLGLGRALRRARAGQTVASPGETVEGWLSRNGQGPRMRELLWEPLALAALNQSPHDAAAPPFVGVLADLFGGDAQAAAVVLPAVPLHQMYAEPARDFIEARDGSVRMNAPAVVHVTPAGRLEVEVEAERHLARHVIVTAPWHALAVTLSQALASGPLARLVDAARRTESSPIVTVNLWFDRPLLDAPFYGLPGRLMQWVFDKGAIFGARANHLSLVSSGAADVYRRTNDVLIAQALEEVLVAFPEARAARLMRATVVREPHATFSLAPGQPARPGPITTVPGLLLAGDWTDTGLPATIEGAVQSGHIAAALAAP